LNRGQDVLLKIDIQGADSIRRIIPMAVTVFLAPPSLEELERRLRFRKSETIMDIRTRIEAAHGELAVVNKFDYKVVNVNQRLDLAAFCIDSIITAERCRIGRSRTEFI
jgi:guanylate kinase